MTGSIGATNSNQCPLCPNSKPPEDLLCPDCLAKFYNEGANKILAGKPDKMVTDPIAWAIALETLRLSTVEKSLQDLRRRQEIELREQVEKTITTSGLDPSKVPEGTRLAIFKRISEDRGVKFWKENGGPTAIREKRFAECGLNFLKEKQAETAKSSRPAELVATASSSAPENNGHHPIN